MDTVFEIMKVMRAARILAGLSQQELAALAGISRQMVVRIEKNDGKGVPVAALHLLRLALEKSAIEFIPSTPDRGPGIALKREITAKSDDGTAR